MPNALITQHNHILRIQLNRPQTKMLLRRGDSKALEETMALELGLIGERLVSDETRGIMQAFLARRGKE